MTCPAADPNVLPNRAFAPAITLFAHAPHGVPARPHRRLGDRGPTPPAIDRTVALVTFLADNPGQSFSLSELARRLELNKATAHAMVVALTESGWLVRHPVDKAYRLGPALVAIGHAATAAAREALEAARPLMRRLADERGTQCVATAVVGDEMVIVAVEGRPHALGLTAQPGYRAPLAPPFGTVFLAWADQQAVARWFDQLGPDEERRAAYRDAIAAIRERGYALGLEGDQAARLQAARAGLVAAAAEQGVSAELAQLLAQVDDGGDYLLSHLEGSTAYALNMIAAPVFDRDGRVVLALTLMGFRQRLRAEEVAAYADPLCAVAAEVTLAVGGHPPAPPTA